MNEGRGAAHKSARQIGTVSRARKIGAEICARRALAAAAAGFDPVLGAGYQTLKRALR
jgi:hypothetical protein